MLTIWSSASSEKLTVMTSTIGRMPPSAAPMPGTDEARLRQRGVPDALRSELLEQAERDAEAAPVRADVLAHQEDAVVALHGLAHRLTDRLAVGGHGAPPADDLGVHEPREVLDRLVGARLGEGDGVVDLVRDLLLELLLLRRR